ncbi:MAG: WD40 repeat domain-containing protein [Psychromonas sp.]
MQLANTFKSLLLVSTLFLTACEQYPQPLQQFEHAAEGAFSADISNNGDYSLISSIHHGISLWDNRNNKLLFNWYHHQNQQNDVFIVRLSANNSVALTASRNEFALWDTKTGKSLGFYQVSDSPIRDIQLSENGNIVAYGQVNGKLVHINLRTGRRLEAPLHREKVNSIDMSSNGRYVLSGGNDHQAFLWDTDTAQVIQRFDFNERVSLVRLEKKGLFAFIADTQKASQIWNLQTGKLQSTLIYKARQSIFSTVRFIKDGQYLLTGNATQSVSLWDTDTGLKQQEWAVTARKETRPKTAVVYSASLWNDSAIATESSAGLLEIWPLAPL